MEAFFRTPSKMDIERMGERNIRIYDQIQHFGAKKYLLIGNGLNKSLGIDFDWDSIKREIRKNCKNHLIKEILDHKNTDLERCLKIFDNLVEAKEFFSSKINLNIDEIREARDLLRQNICEEIHKKHASKDDYQEQIKRLVRRISQFDAVFTLNYDLLLYWTILKCNEKNPYLFNDGFGGSKELGRIWGENSNSQNIFFLHGALHLYRHHEATYKHAHSNRGILSQVKLHLIEKKYPMFISEGLSHQKLSKIEDNKYLKFGLNALRGFEKNRKLNNTNEKISLVIFGSHLKANDDHIVDAIKSNKKISEIFCFSVNGKKEANEKLNISEYFKANSFFI